MTTRNVSDFSAALGTLVGGWYATLCSQELSRSSEKRTHYLDYTSTQIDTSESRALGQHLIRAGLRFHS